MRLRVGGFGFGREALGDDLVGRPALELAVRVEGDPSAGIPLAARAEFRTGFLLLSGHCVFLACSDPWFEPIIVMRQRCAHHLVSGRTPCGPDHDPSCLRARARRNGTLLGSAACFSPGSARPPSTPDQRQPRAEPRIGLRSVGGRSARLGRLQHGAGGHQAVGDEAPQCDQQLARERGDGDALDPAATVTHPVAMPDAQGAVGGVARRSIARRYSVAVMNKRVIPRPPNAQFEQTVEVGM